jgi:hypothetical protein
MMIPLYRRKRPDLAGTPVAYAINRSRTMILVARVSAVFLLVLGVWMCGVSSGEVHPGRSSAGGPVQKDDVGVGTRLAALDGEVSGQDEGRNVAKVKPLAIFREVEKGWRDGTPKPFERYFGKGKVRLDFGEGGPRGGLFTGSQAYYLLEDYFGKTHTLEIGFLRTSGRARQGSRPYALLERKCRYKNGVIKKEIVFVSLSLEDDQWIISELRAIPAR